MSSIPGVSQKLTPSYPPGQTPGSGSEPPATQSLIRSLGLEPHVEGGYFAEIDRNPWLVPNPFLSSEKGDGGNDDDEGGKMTASAPLSGDDSKRNASTSIYYMLSALSPQGCFHRNRGRTIHTLIRGKARYVLIHADEPGTKKAISREIEAERAELRKGLEEILKKGL